jgi:Outer membrane protein Omp28
MKNRFLQFSMLAVTAASLVFASCSKEETKAATTSTTGTTSTAGPSVPEVNTAMINKYTGSKCGPCGSWGWDMAIELIDYAPTKAIYVGTFSQNFVAEEFITTTATTWDKALTGSGLGYPTFAVNNVAQLDRTSGVNTGSEKAKCKAAIDKHSTAPVMANVGFKTAWAQDADGFWTVTITSATKFFKDNSGDFYVGCYLLEDKAIGKQSGHTPSTNVEHHHVLRQAVGNKDYGDLVSSGAIAAGKTFEKTYTSLIPKNFKKDNMEVLFVIWKKNGTKCLGLFLIRKDSNC